MKYSVLQSFNRKYHFFKEPFPHVLIENALPKKLYEDLLLSFPNPSDLDVNNLLNNKRYSYPAKKVKTNQRISKIWKDFINFHISKIFYEEVINIFGKDIISCHRDFFKDLSHLKKLDINTRFESEIKNKYTISLDAQISGNTPVWFPNSVRKAHIDSGEKLFSGLFYLRNPEDDSLGGNLCIYKPKDNYKNSTNLFYESYVNRKKCEIVKEIPYKGNTLIIFINTPYSIHGVTPRSITKHNRIFMNLVGSLPFNLYDISKQSTLKKIYRSLFF